jgi:hypothetical protein
VTISMIDSGLNAAWRINRLASPLLIKQQLHVAPTRGTQDEGDAGEEAARKAQEAKMAKAREMRKQTDPG